jgi:hypothetical protein
MICLFENLTLNFTPMIPVILAPVLIATYLTGCTIALGIYIGQERNFRQPIQKIVTCAIVTALSWASVGWVLGKILRGN